MGIFGNSFKRELGKNTAKRVSNAIFGDKWSTPYKRVSSPKEPSASSIAQREHNEIQREKNELKRRQLEIAEANARANSSHSEAQAEIRRAEAKRIQDGQMWELDSAVIKNVDAVIAIEIPTQETELENLTLKLCNQMSTEHWSEVDKFGKKTQEGAIRDKYVDALFSKFKACYTRLKLSYSTNQVIPYITDQIFTFEQQKRAAQIWKLGNNAEAIATIEIPEDEKSLVKLIDELSSHYDDAKHQNIRHKYWEAIYALERINPDNHKLNAYYKHHRNLMWKQNKKVYVYLIGILALLYIIGLAFLYLNRIPTQHTIGRWIISIVYIVAALVFIIKPSISWFNKKRRLDAYRKGIAR